MCHGIWVNVECLKCGNQNEKKYFVDTLNEINCILKIKCSCGNDEGEFFRLLEFNNIKGKIQ